MHTLPLVFRVKWWQSSGTGLTEWGPVKQNMVVKSGDTGWKRFFSDVGLRPMLSDRVLRYTLLLALFLFFLFYLFSDRLVVGVGRRQYFFEWHYGRAFVGWSLFLFRNSTRAAVPASPVCGDCDGFRLCPFLCRDLESSGAARRQPPRVFSCDGHRVPVPGD